MNVITRVSITLAPVCAIKRPSDVPPVVSNAVSRPVTCLIAERQHQLTDRDRLKTVSPLTIQLSS